MPETAAIILAGGRGERLGGAVKAGLRVGGLRLIERVAARLGPALPVVVAHGAIPADVVGLEAGQVGVPDLPVDRGGPLAGFAAAIGYLAALPAPPARVVCVAVDTPFLPFDYLDRLSAAIGDADVAVAGWRGQAYPTDALWRLDAVHDLPRRLREGSAPHSLRRLIADLAAVQVGAWDADEADPFASVNTPAELAAAEARARREGR